ncbi:hypothetical protein LBMAG42_08410 [Deltaproteobacteria bacterium]|nr:hypothetical protein LBMAG42_08410 [Deltaproteobacteria bacterium]
MIRLSLLLLALAACAPDDTGAKTTANGGGEEEDADQDGWTVADGDCADEDAAQNPDAVELCDGIDNDCNGAVDDGAGTVTWYEDTDGDGFGDPAAPVSGCEQPVGSSVNSTDCDDTNAAINPAAAEVDCDDQTDLNCDGVVTFPDADADGWDQCADCADDDAAVFPGAPELCNELDDDCDGVVDPDSALDAAIWSLDADGDGYGDASAILVQCDQPAGYVEDASDCDDASTVVNPAATEVCDDLDVDENCDGLVDDDDPGVDASSLYEWWIDADGDGYGDDATLVQACAAPASYVGVDGDCDDADLDVHPGAPEADCADRKDYNCDGSVSYADADADGAIACDDCDDADAAVFPGATEVCNGLDDDCDGVVDPSTASGALEWYADTDADGYGDAASPTDGCSAPAGYVGDATDCDDASPSVYPGAPEYCNAIDDDCDGGIDPVTSVDASTWYADADGDTFGDLTSTTAACSEPAGFLADNADCDDADADVHPGATEYCNGLDDDCDSVVDPDSAFDALTWYADADADTYGDVATTTAACAEPAGFVADDTDCNDADATINPAASEVCDAADVDEDCDTFSDDADPSTDTTSMTAWYVDNDGDGYGDPATAVTQCEAPTDAISDGTDCDDTRSGVHPGGTEICDALHADEDCDGLADDDDPSVNPTTLATWYTDADGDGYGDGGVSYACDIPAGYAASDTDCNDADAAINPAASEVCDTADTDEDCDGNADDDDSSVASSGFSTWYADADGDGFGDATLSDDACDEPTGYVADNTDCDDTDALLTTSCSTTFSGAVGTTWYTMRNGTEALYSMMTHHTSDIPYIYNMYDATGQYYDTAANTWTTLTTAAPYSSPWTSMAPWDGYLWMIRNQRVYKYDPATDVWTSVTSISGGDDYNMTESDEYGVIYGHTNNGRIVEYDTTTGTLSYVTTGKGGQYETRMAYDATTRAIFFGAYSARNLYKMDIATGTVTTMTPIPESQLNDIFCSDRSGHIYAAGGSSGTTMYQYDIATNAWAAIAALPSDHGNNGSCTVSYEGWLYVGTGSNYKLHRIELY